MKEQLKHIGQETGTGIRNAGFLVAILGIIAEAAQATAIGGPLVGIGVSAAAGGEIFRAVVKAS